MIDKIDQVKESLDIFKFAYNISSTNEEMRVNHNTYRNDTLHIFNVDIMSDQSYTHKVFRAIVEDGRNYIQFEISDLGSRVGLHPDKVKATFKSIDPDNYHTNSTFYINSIDQLNDILAVLTA